MGRRSWTGRNGERGRIRSSRGEPSWRGAAEGPFLRGSSEALEKPDQEARRKGVHAHAPCQLAVLISWTFQVSDDRRFAAEQICGSGV